VQCIYMQQLAVGSLARYGVRGEVCVADDNIIAMAHGSQSVEDIGIEKWIKILEHVRSYLRIPLGILLRGMIAPGCWMTMLASRCAIPVANRGDFPAKRAAR
jgi:hypothetical protein